MLQCCAHSAQLPAPAGAVQFDALDVKCLSDACEIPGDTIVQQLSAEQQHTDLKHVQTSTRTQAYYNSSQNARWSNIQSDYLKQKTSKEEGHAIMQDWPMKNTHTMLTMDSLSCLVVSAERARALRVSFLLMASATLLSIILQVANDV